jgi:hypothetical protein
MDVSARFAECFLWLRLRRLWGVAESSSLVRTQPRQRSFVESRFLL